MNVNSPFIEKRVNALFTIIENVKVKWSRYKAYKFFSAQFKDFIESHHFENKKLEGEDAYIQKWSALSKKVEVYSYRFFSHYCGLTPNIVPENIGRYYIEPFLNPVKYRYPYADKNMFPRIIGKEYVPRTVVCRINGRMLLDSDFTLADKDLKKYIGDSTSLILKPSVGTNSGDGVIKFNKVGEEFVSIDGKVTLTKEFLMSYGRNFCLQEAVCQHEFMNHLCATSVNTIRLCLYRSLSDNQSVVTAGIIRIGKQGAIVDNAHAGGVFVGVDMASGELDKHIIGQDFYKHDKWNDVDFSKETLVVPNWDEVIDFAKYIGTRLPHHRLIALDIALDTKGKPILIEYNIDFFGYWLFMLTNQEVFGKYTDEVIDYCKMLL